VEWITKLSAPRGASEYDFKNPAGGGIFLLAIFLHIGSLFYFTKEEEVSILGIAKTIF